jgi:hypothetical protein
MRVSKAELNPRMIDMQTRFMVIFPTPTAATSTGLFNYPINTRFNDSISMNTKFLRIDGIIIFNIISSFY